MPALFNGSVFTQLLSLEGDAGAKYLIGGLGDAVGIVPFPKGIIDVDTKEAYRQIIASVLNQESNDF